MMVLVMAAASTSAAPVLFTGMESTAERSATSRSAFRCETAASSVGHVRTTLFWPFGWTASTR